MRNGHYFYNLSDNYELVKIMGNNMTENTKQNKLTEVLFAVYLIAIVWILLFKLGVHFSYMGNSRIINLLPYREPLFLHGKFDWSETIMNVLIFVPLGIYVGILFKRWKVGKKLFLVFITSLIVEVFQYILAIGAADITDLINNTIGGIIGLMIYIGIEKAVKNPVKAQKFINVIATIGTFTMIVLLFLLKTNHLGIRYQ